MFDKAKWKAKQAVREFTQNSLVRELASVCAQGVVFAAASVTTIVVMTVALGYGMELAKKNAQSENQNEEEPKEE